MEKLVNHRAFVQVNLGFDRAVVATSVASVLYRRIVEENLFAASDLKRKYVLTFGVTPPSEFRRQFVQFLRDSAS